jgi:hypothetical protein
MLQGLARGAFEGANRAVIAVMFTAEEASAAFATMLLFGGSGSTVAYAVFKSFMCVRAAAWAACVLLLLLPSS